jgi:CubicO group peptidase (beta-lactamase class C family)
LSAELVGQPQAAVPQDQVDKVFSRWSSSTPGCAVGANVAGQTVVRSAYGMADLERDVPNTASTVFDAGSVAKQFTAAALLLLAREGKLSLDDPVRKYVPELPDYGVPVTIRQVLDHTSGLRDWLALESLAIAAGQRGLPERGRIDALAILGRQRALNFPPGTRWSYSNSGYALASLIIARVSGTSFAEFTSRRIFQPLGMNATSWQLDLTRMVKHRALGYGERDGTWVLDMPVAVVDGSGALLTTVDDLLKWQDNFRTHIVGDAAFVREMQRRATFADGRTHDYAMGLFVDTYRGVPEADHGGAWAGYRAYVSRYPNQQIGIVVLCNSATANPRTHGKALANLLLGDMARASTSSEPPSTAIGDAFAERVVGLYRRSPQAGSIRVVRDGNALLFDGGSPLIEMTPSRLARLDNGYTMDLEGGGRFRYVDEYGTVDLYERVEPARPTIEQLRFFAGDYVSDEIQTTLTLVIEGDQLTIRRTPQSIALTPVYNDAFCTRIGFIVFERDSAGRVTGLTLTEERVWNLRFTRRAGENSASVSAAPISPK